MGAARVIDWTQPASPVAARKPSWLAPPLPKPIDPRPRLSVVPPPRLASVAPPASSRAEARRSSEDVEAHEETVRSLTLELEDVRTMVAELASRLATERRRILEASEGELVTLAIAIAERVVGDAVSADPGLITAWARDAIAALPARETMVVAMSPDLAERVPESAWASATGGAHRLEVDASLGPSTCEVRAGAATVEVSAAARIAAAVEAIS